VSFQTFELSDGASTATVVPERGGLVSRFAVGGEDVLFLDPATLADPAKNVRGGIPILFPFAGKPPVGSPLKQHGFARTLPWAVLEADKARLVCALEATDATRAAFPHDFRLELTVALSGPCLSLHFALQNRGAEPMPLHFGLHPYFAVPLEAKRTARVETRAATAYNQRTGLTGPLPAIDFAGAEVDLHLLDHGAPRTVLHGRRDVALSWSPGLTTLVLWTLPDQPFICVEPWSAPAGTFGQRLLAPETTAAFDFQIRAV
jgi:galactose mutarotase-like enzyme